MAVNLRLASRQPVYAPDASVVVDVAIENGSAATVSVPDLGMPGVTQPRFTLRTPDGQAISFVPADGRRVRPGAAAPDVDVAPGGSATGDLELRDFAALDQTGDYVLDATLQLGAATVVAQATRFKIEPVPVQDPSAFMSRSPDGEPATGLVVLARRRHAGTVLVREEDPRNGELFSLEVQQGPELERPLRTLGWYANHDLAFDPLRWMLAVTHGGLAAATNQSPKPAEAAAGRRVSLWLNGLVRKGRLAVPAIAGDVGAEAELLWFIGTAPGGEPRLDGPKRLAGFSGTARAGAATLAPKDGQTLVAVAVPADDGTRVLAWLIADDAVRAAKEYRVPGLRDARALAVGWSSRDVLTVSVLGSDAARQVRIADLTLRPDLSPLAPPAVSEALGLSDPREASLAMFEQVAGTLSRVAVVRTASGASAISPGNRVRPLDMPAGPYALLPGRSRWYVLWSDGAQLRSTSF
ncbi:hypothetical protein [Aquabacterium sp.]|uniref:hypothetical protein n=1 Tax=Aquabacterium sp. TaxID=1872578 RepID=UPI002CABA5CE|nr:hypothetical protein [Aquabacterium sp.]HSW08898.1 hypothetical protein [Aquabacterium sp.]